jgi:hypothetical protein
MNNYTKHKTLEDELLFENNKDLLAGGAAVGIGTGYLTSTYSNNILMPIILGIFAGGATFLAAYVIKYLPKDKVTYG